MFSLSVLLSSRPTCLALSPSLSICSICSFKTSIIIFLDFCLFVFCSLTGTLVSWHFPTLSFWSASLAFTVIGLVFLSLLPLRLQRRGDGGRPWQAAGVLRDLVRLISHSALPWPGERRRLQQHRCRFGPSGRGAAQRRAGSSQAVGPRSYHSAGHPQHRLREVRHNTDMCRILI